MAEDKQFSINMVKGETTFCLTGVKSGVSAVGLHMYNGVV